MVVISGRLAHVRRAGTLLLARRFVWRDAPRRLDGICFPDPGFASGRSCLKIWAERSERLPQLLGQLVGVSFSAFEAAASNFEAAFRF